MDETVKILCVDDERNVLKALRRLFLDEDRYEIFTAESGEAGLQLLAQQPAIQLVISDYRMPGLNGVEFLRRVREQWPDTVRMVLSGYADTAAVVEAINTGQIYKFIPKPWNDDELRTTVGKALEHYALYRRNIRLSAELQEKNEELRNINENLEMLVEERTAELELRNQILSVSQQVLDVLPVAVVGVDPEGMIAQSNEQASRLFDHAVGEMLGCNRREILPAPVNRALDGMTSGCAYSVDLELAAQPFRMVVAPLADDATRGVVVAWLPYLMETSHDG